MILTQLVVENVGVFKGRNEFDLRPARRPARPVVLIGGMNGTGKTTILECIRLALYGPSVLGSPPSEISRRLSALIHHHASLLVPLDSASVELEFELVHLGVTSSYRVARQWRRQNESIDVQVRLFKDGRKLDEVVEGQ